MAKEDETLGRDKVIEGPAARTDLSDGITADQDATVAAAAGLRLVGWAARESAGTAAAAAFDIIHGATADGGTILVPVELAANGSHFEWCWPGIACPDGLSIDIIAGTVDVTLYYVTAED